jgi:hypothetical protein
VVPLEIDSSDEDLGKYSPATPEHEEVEEDPPQLVTRPILRSPTRTVRMTASGNEPTPRRQISYAEEVQDDAGGRAPVKFEPPPGRKKLTGKRASRRPERLRPWERKFYDEDGNYRIKGYTPPGSYTPPEITGLTPPQEEPEWGEFFTLDDPPGEPAPIMRPRPDDFDEEVEVVYDETGQRVPIKERLGPRLTKSQRRKR